MNTTPASPKRASAENPFRTEEVCRFPRKDPSKIEGLYSAPSLPVVTDHSMAKPPVFTAQRNPVFVKTGPSRQTVVAPFRANPIPLNDAFLAQTQRRTERVS